MKTITIEVTNEYHALLIPFLKASRLTPSDFLTIFASDVLERYAEDESGSTLEEHIVDAIVYEYRKDALAVCAEINRQYRYPKRKPHYHVVSSAMRSGYGWMVTKIDAYKTPIERELDAVSAKDVSKIKAIMERPQLMVA